MILVGSFSMLIFHSGGLVLNIKTQSAPYLDVFVIIRLPGYWRGNEISFSVCRKVIWTICSEYSETLIKLYA